MIIKLLPLAGYILAIKSYHSKKLNLSVAIIVLCGLLLKLSPALNPWIHDWDERYHGLVARNLTKHFLLPTLYDKPLVNYDFRNWTENYIWLHKQPVTLWIIAISLKIFGYSALAVRIPSLLFTSICTYLIYDIGQLWFNKRVGIFSAYLFSVNGLILDLATGNDNTDHVDIFFLCFIILSVWLVIRAHKNENFLLHAIAGAIMGIAFLTKWLPALIIMPIWFMIPGIEWKRNRDHLMVAFTYFILTAAFIAVPWQLYIIHFFPKEAYWEYHFNSLHFTHALEDYSGPWYYHLEHLIIFYGEATPIPIAWFLFSLDNYKKTAKLALVSWFILPYLFFSISATKMPAYTLIAAPAVFIMTSALIDKWLIKLKDVASHKFTVILMVLLILSSPSEIV